MRTLLVATLGIAIAFGGVLLICRLFEVRLLDPVFVSGWVLVAVMAFQLVMRIKNRFPSLVPGTALVWTRRHTATGLFGLLVFAHHVGYSLPDTGFELALFIIFSAVAGSGLVGLYLTTVLPHKIEEGAASGKFEDLSALSAEIAEAARRLVALSVERTGSRVFLELYTSQLHNFFERPHHAVSHLNGSRKPLQRLEFEIDQAEGRAGADLDSLVSEFKTLVRAKYALDGRHAHERALGAWLYIHLPMSYALIVLTILHTCIVYAFTSGGADLSGTAVGTVETPK